MEISEELLWDYAEGLLSDDERKQMETLLSADPVWAHKLEEIKLMSAALGQMETTAPSMRFTRSVMEVWDIEMDLKAHPLKTHTNKKLVMGIASILGLCLLTVFGIFVFQALKHPVDIISDENVRSLSLHLQNITQHSKLTRYLLIGVLLLSLLFIERFLHYRNFVKEINRV